MDKASNNKPKEPSAWQRLVIRTIPDLITPQQVNRFLNLVKKEYTVTEMELMTFMVSVTRAYSNACKEQNNDKTERPEGSAQLSSNEESKENPKEIE